MTYFLLSLLLSATTGETFSTEVIGGPFTDVEQCSHLAQNHGVEHPKDGAIRVYECVALRGGARA